MSVEFHTLRVGSVVPETSDCNSFELIIPEPLRRTYAYRAGQHLTFKLPWNGAELTRCYSLSSCPDLGEPHRIAVKRVEGGRVSNWLNDHVKVGDSLVASIPEGRFVLDPETRSSTPLFLFAGGSGITPIISLLKSALRTTKRTITVLYANQNPDSVIYRDELDQLAARHPDRVSLRYHFDSERGYVDRDAIMRLLHHEDIAEFYLCGPEPFMELIVRTLTEAGVHEELIYVERFVSPADPDSGSEAALDLSSLETPETFSLWLGGRSRTVPYVEGHTLLQCAQAAGLHPAHSCESGFCGSCMAAVKTGNVVMRRHEALSDRDVARGVTLLCQSFPTSRDPLELDGDSTSFRAASAVKSSLSKTWSRLAAMAVFGLMVAGTLVLRLVN